MQIYNMPKNSTIINHLRYDQEKFGPTNSKIYKKISLGDCGQLRGYNFPSDKLPRYLQITGPRVTVTHAVLQGLRHIR